MVDEGGNPNSANVLIADMADLAGRGLSDQDLIHQMNLTLGRAAWLPANVARAFTNLGLHHGGLEGSDPQGDPWPRPASRCYPAASASNTPTSTVSAHLGRLVASRLWRPIVLLSNTHRWVHGQPECYANMARDDHSKPRPAVSMTHNVALENPAQGPFPESVDVLIAGAGNAAMCAAIEAARVCGGRKRIAVAEAAPKFMRGGNTRHTRNMRLAHVVGNEIFTDGYPAQELLADLRGVTGPNSDPELAELLVDQSLEMFDWMRSNGVVFAPSLEGTLSLGRTNAFFLGGGRAMLNALHRTAAELGVEVFYDTEVVDLTIESATRRCTAATVQHGDTTSEVEVGAFVAASGGFEANLDWLEQAWGPAAKNFIVRGTPYNRGSLLRVFEALGVKVIGDPKQCHAIALDGRAPQFDGGIVTRLDCVPFGIVVNQNSERFYDEGQEFWPKRYAIWGRMVADQPDQVAHVVIDSNAIDLFMPSVFPPEQADTLDELAMTIGLDPAKLTNTVRSFNDACTGGQFDTTVHDGCGTAGLEPPKTNWARPITDPPFYAYTLRCGITFTYLATKIDREARVVTNDGPVSPNVFAAGEIMAGNVLDQGYLAGLGMTIGSVFGRIAGRGAANA